MRAIQPPWHGWEKINLMNSGCEGKAVLGHSHWEQRRKETVSCYLAAVWSQGVVWAWVSCWSQAGPLLHKALVAAPRQSHCLWDTPGSALRSLSSFQQATPVNIPLLKKKWLCPCPRHSASREKWDRTTTRFSFSRDCSVLAGELPT